jgi:alpha-amylase
MGDNTISLPDLRTEDSAVASVLNSWIKDLVVKYSIDGLRLDSTQQVNNDFLPPFESAGKFQLTEDGSGLTSSSRSLYSR